MVKPAVSKCARCHLPQGLCKCTTPAPLYYDEEGKFDVVSTIGAYGLFFLLMGGIFVAGLMTGLNCV